MTSSSVDDLVLSWLRSQESDEAAAYAQSGRRHAEIPLDQLSGLWLRTFAELADNPKSGELHRALSELRAELTLRGVEPPYHLVPDEVREKFMKAGIEAARAIESDPDRLDQVNNELADDLMRFQGKLDDAS